MARLETQINQIYLNSPEAKKTSLILYEEQLTPSLQLFVVAELWNIQKKSEAGDLKKISEIILQSFRGNKKLPAESLFETSLSQINQNLADLAHEGRKSWVGKFSCLICIRAADNNIYLANNGQTLGLLKRKSELMEILPAEKRGNHPLKTFINFTQGKLTDNDSLILTTSNIFNYISFELFSKIINQNALDQACEQISKILRESMSDDVGFSSFLMHFTKKPLEETLVAGPIEDIYAPIPEEVEMAPVSKFKFKIPKLSSVSLPSLPTFKFSLPKVPMLNWACFQNLSKPGKFFFISFVICLLLFLINVGIWASKINVKKTESRIEELIAQINLDVEEVNAALIYKDENKALENLAKTLTDLEELSKLDNAKALEMTPQVEQVKTVLNKINTVTNLDLSLELKHQPLYLSSTAIGQLFGNEDSNSLSRFNQTLTDYFLLNSLSEPIKAINYFPPAGVVVASGSQIYRVNETLKQFESILNIEGGPIKQIRVANNAIYALLDDKIMKITYTRSRYQSAVSLTGELSEARDIAVDRDIYVLYANKVVKYVSGEAQAFPMPNMSDKLTNGDKIVTGSNLYILESNKKRVIVLNKNGALINQIYFPTTQSLRDFYVDEASRSLYLLDDNKLYKITF